MVRNAILLIIISSDLLATVHCAHLGLSFLGFLFNVLFIFDFEKSLFKNLGSSLSISVLASVFLDENAHSCRDVGRPACAFGFVHRLSSRAA